MQSLELNPKPGPLDRKTTPYSAVYTQTPDAESPSQETCLHQLSYEERYRALSVSRPN